MSSKESGSGWLWSFNSWAIVDDGERGQSNKRKSSKQQLLYSWLVEKEVFRVLTHWPRSTTTTKKDLLYFKESKMKGVIPNSFASKHFPTPNPVFQCLADSPIANELSSLSSPSLSYRPPGLPMPGACEPLRCVVDRLLGPAALGERHTRPVTAIGRPSSGRYVGVVD